MFKIGDLSNICNVSIKTIRFYELKSLLAPVKVDRYTGYRYFDESSVKRIQEILFFKNLGMTIKQIKTVSFDDVLTQQNLIAKQINELQSKIQALNSLKNNKGEIVMNKFVNDEDVIGKWSFIAFAKDKEDFYKNRPIDEVTFLKEIYFMENGQGYWVIHSWTKGIITLFPGEYPIPVDNSYEIEGDYLFINIVDENTNESSQVAVYKRVNRERYTPKDLERIDDVKLPFENNKKVIGIWKGIAIVVSPDVFNPTKHSFQSYLFSLTFNEGGNLIVKYTNGNIFNEKWTNNLWLNLRDKVAQKYEIKNIDGKEYMFVEHKNGDYTYCGNISSYFVLERQR